MKPELVMSIKSREKTILGIHPLQETSLGQLKPTSALSPSLTKYDSDDYLLKILEAHHLIISQEFRVNMMAIPNHCIREAENRIKEVEQTPGQSNPDILLVAQMELAFLDAKECVSFFTDTITMAMLVKYKEEGVYPAAIFTSIQVWQV